MASDKSPQLGLFGAISASPVYAQPAAEQSQRVTPAVIVAESQINSVMEPVKATQAIPSTKIIEDAGAELTYNRRNRVRTAKTWNDFAELNDVLKVKEVIKTNVWLKPDYEQLITDGMPPIIAHLVKQVYDSVAPKPVVRDPAKLDSSLQTYINAISRVQEGLMSWAKNPESLQYWATENARYAGAMLGKRVELSAPSGVRKSLLDIVYPTGWRDNREEIMVAGANKLLGALQPGYKEANRAVKSINEGWPVKRELWEIQGFRILPAEDISVKEQSLRISGVHVAYFRTNADAEKAHSDMKAFLLLSKRGFVGSFDSEELAIEYAKEKSRSASKTTTISEKGTSVERAEREGVVRRMPDEEITSERLMQEFGLKGVNFGNWMKTPSARAEAQLHLNHSFDSFHDLAEVLGIPPKAIGLNGMLGLAIGAQGGGNAAAHFVPGVNEINLTRSSGAGSLAHEWGHAIDHYFAIQAELATSNEPFLSEHSTGGPGKRIFQMVDGRQVAVTVPRYANLRPEIAAGFSAIVESMNRRMEMREEHDSKEAAYKETTKTNLTKWLKYVRKDFSGAEVQFDAISEQIMNGDIGEGWIAVSKSTHICPAVAELRDLHKSVNKRVCSIDNSKGLQSAINSFQYANSKSAKETEFKPASVTSTYSRNADKLDAAKGGKAYWSTNLEKFARAFDAYVSDKLEERSALNSYLSNAGRSDESVPTGTERVSINAAFTALLGEFQTRETERGTQLYSFNEAPNKKTLSSSEIIDEVTRIHKQWPGMPKVHVVNSVADLPFASPENVDGSYIPSASGLGQVYVVANQIGSIKDLQRVLAHECIMHHTLPNMLGQHAFNNLHKGIQVLKAKNDPVISAIAENIGQRYGKLEPLTETHEILARAGEMCLDDKGDIRIGFGFVKGMFAGVAGFLRKHGLDVPFTNIELQGIMHKAGKLIQRPNEKGVFNPSFNKLDKADRDSSTSMYGSAGVLYHAAFHGSPHDFDKFSTEAIGTGDGNQSFGYGLYFSDSHEVADGYRKSLSHDAGYSFGGQLRLSRDQVHEAVKAIHGSDFLDNVIRPSGVADHVMDALSYGSVNPTPRGYNDGSERAQLFSTLMSQIEHSSKGHLYHVDIRDEEVDNFLKWDKPLSEQSENVQAYAYRMFGGDAPVYREAQGVHVDLTELSAIEKKVYEILAAKQIGKITTRSELLIEANQTGEQLYHHLSDISGGPKWTSLDLSEAGVKGVVYLDGLSRHAPLINLEKYSKKVEAAKLAFEADSSQEIQSWLDDAMQEQAEMERANAERSTYNFVVFDDTIISLSHKNGLDISHSERAAFIDGSWDKCAKNAQGLQTVMSVGEYVEIAAKVEVAAKLAQDKVSELLNLPGAPVVVQAGTFNGKVLEVNDHFVTQSTGRGRSVRHAANNLNQDVKAGDVIDVKYKDGVGQVNGVARSNGVEL